MSAVIIGLGGAYFTAYQRCVGDANAIIATYTKIEKEISERDSYIRSALNHAKSAADLTEAVHNCPTFYADFKQHSSRELHYEYHELQKYIEIDVADVERRKRKAVAEIPTKAFLEGDKYNALIDCEMPPNFKDEDLDAARRSVSEPFRYGLSILGSLLPNCSIGNVLSEWFSGQRGRIVRYAPIWSIEYHAS